MSRTLIGVLSLAVLSSISGCGSQRAAPGLTELQRMRNGNVEVILLAPANALTQTRNYCTVEFRSTADQQLVDVGTVTVRTSMTMEGAPMDGFVTAPRALGPGRYSVEMVLAMAGDWRIGIEWMGPAGTGSVSFPAVIK
jgi:hypothetical protein